MLIRHLKRIQKIKKVWINRYLKEILIPKYFKNYYYINITRSTNNHYYLCKVVGISRVKISSLRPILNHLIYLQPLKKPKSFVWLKRHLKKCVSNYLTRDFVLFGLVPDGCEQRSRMEWLAFCVCLRPVRCKTVMSVAVVVATVHRQHPTVNASR
jgi:hypothetical protein